jgi:hypothetical protein
MFSSWEIFESVVRLLRRWKDESRPGSAHKGVRFSVICNPQSAI